MNFKEYMEQNKPQLPPNLDIGMQFAQITKVEENTFDLDGKPTKGMRVFTDLGEYKTSSSVIMEILKGYFEKHKEPAVNLRVVQPRGKRYLTLEGF